MEIFAFENNLTLLAYIPQLLLAEILFTFYMKKRNNFLIRVLSGGVIFLLVAYFIPIAVYQTIHGFLTMMVFIISLFYVWFCFRHSFWDVLFCCLGAVTTQNLADNVANRIIFNSFAGPKDLQLILAYILMVLCYIIIYLVCFVLFARKLKGVSDYSIGRISLIVLLSGVLFITFTLQFLLMQTDYDTYLTRIPFICIGLMSLCLQYGLFERSKLKEEKAILEELLRKEERQYRIKEDNIDIINQKCHDLKNQLSVIRHMEVEGKEEIKAIENSIMLYDSIAKTGNKALDVILSEKSFLCEKYNVRFTYMVDGSLLDFIKPMDIASIFGNALDNAIEHLQKLDEDKRVISMNVYRLGGLVTIHIENPCVQDLELVNGLPKTSKENKNYHGYGLKSIDMIVSKYNGKMVLGTPKDRFCLDIIFLQN